MFPPSDRSKPIIEALLAYPDEMCIRDSYLTMQLMELDTPMVLALNMMDEVRGNGGTVRINKMEAMLGIPVIPISAAKNEGVDELVDHALHVAKYQERPGRMDFCSEDDHGGAVHRCIPVSYTHLGWWWRGTPCLPAAP